MDRSGVTTYKQGSDNGSHYTLYNSGFLYMDNVCKVRVVAIYYAVLVCYRS